MELCMPSCPANEAEHCDILCPENSTCNGVPNNRGEHECMLFCCFPLHILAYIIITPCCLCNMCCSVLYCNSKNKKEQTIDYTGLQPHNITSTTNSYSPVKDLEFSINNINNIIITNTTDLDCVMKEQHI